MTDDQPEQDSCRLLPPSGNTTSTVASPGATASAVMKSESARPLDPHETASPKIDSACPNHPRSARPRRRPASACSSTVAHSWRVEEPDTLTGSISRYRQHLPNVALVDQGRARPCGRRGAPSSDGAATRCYPILRATATTPTSRPRAPVTDRTTRHHGRYRWNPSPDARECAPSHRRRPGAARSFRPPPHPSTGPFHSRKESRSRKHLAADPWTPPPSRLVSAIYRVRGRNGEPCLVAANSSTLLRGMLPLPQTSSKGIALTASSRTWSGPRRGETSASPPGSGSPSCPAR